MDRWSRVVSCVVAELLASVMIFAVVFFHVFAVEERPGNVEYRLTVSGEPNNWHESVNGDNDAK